MKTIVIFKIQQPHIGSSQQAETFILSWLSTALPKGLRTAFI